MQCNFRYIQNDDTNGANPLECFVLLDTFGPKEFYSCNDNKTLAKVLKGKENVNLQISLWLEGLKEGSLFMQEVEEYTKDYPEWVLKSVINRYKKYLRDLHGFIPLFLLDF